MGEVISNILNFSIAGFTINKLLSALILVVICLLVVKVLLKGLNRVLERTSMETNLRSIVRTVVKFLLLFLVVLIVMGSLGISITSLVAVLSVVGLAASLAVQNSLSNVAGGIQLMASQPFKLGDYVEAGDTAGTVNSIGLFYTKLLTTDNKLVQIPNSEIANEKITNYTSQENRRVDLKFTTSYDAPADTVKQAVQAVAAAHPLAQPTPEPFVRVSGYGDNAIEYTVRVWCATEDYWNLYFDLMEQVKAAFDQAGVEMTYPHLNVHMVDGTPPQK
ncbi:MAG: mechanosensitive ion channel family protein [Oscillospiraceae bacterium]|nr:mechanosensitive ion channel family protein [Oscillospiraceae bacterium]